MTKPHRRWRPKGQLLILTVVAVGSALLYWEQTAMLYALSTAAICLLLVMVAFADLEGNDTRDNHRAITTSPLSTKEIEVASSPAPLARRVDRRSRDRLLAHVAAEKAEIESHD